MGSYRRDMQRVQVRGVISSAQFSHHGFVIGHWPESPVGPFGDIMHRSPEGERTLFASSQQAADFITRIYAFDHVRVCDLTTESDGKTTRAVGEGIDIELHGGRRRPIPIRRPLAITRFVEGPIAKALMGVKTFGTSETQATEWYQARGWRWVEQGRASLSSRDLGCPTAFSAPMGVGFSEPPPRPSIVAVHVTIELPEDALAP